MEEMPELLFCSICGASCDWIYEPSGNPYCDSCVPRGCSCQQLYFTDYEITPEEKALIRLKFHIETEDYIEELDELGRQMPCIEFYKMEH